MPRTERYPHYVTRTRTDHKCENCGGIIPKGSRWVRYKNLFTGKRSYFHDRCPREVLEARWEKIRQVNQQSRRPE